MQATRTTFIPLLVSAHSERVDPAAVRDEAFAGLQVVYTAGPQFGRRVVTHGDLNQLQLHPQMLRQAAFQHLEVLASRAEFHGQPPALMLSFEGLESSLLLASDFWARMEGAVPGELVVGVPARDVVVVTGSRSGPGLEKAKRCVERVFFAGGDFLISRGLLVRRGGAWEPFDRSARPSGRPQFGPAHLHGVSQPPRQFQEHPSWPGGERIPPQPAAGALRPEPVRRRPMYDVPPALLDQTGTHRMEHTGSHRFDQTGVDQTGSHRLGMTGFQAPVSAITGATLPPPRQPEPTFADHRYDDYVDDSSPYAIAPQSVAPNGVAAHMSPAAYGAGYSDGYSTGSMPRVRDHEPAATSYPRSWGSAPEPTSVKGEFRTGPRARFS